MQVTEMFVTDRVGCQPPGETNRTGCLDAPDLQAGTAASSPPGAVSGVLHVEVHFIRWVIC